MHIQWLFSNAIHDTTFLKVRPTVSRHSSRWNNSLCKKSFETFLIQCKADTSAAHFIMMELSHTGDKESMTRANTCRKGPITLLCETPLVFLPQLETQSWTVARCWRPKKIFDEHNCPTMGVTELLFRVTVPITANKSVMQWIPNIVSFVLPGFNEQTWNFHFISDIFDSQPRKWKQALFSFPETLNLAFISTHHFLFLWLRCLIRIIALRNFIGATLMRR